MSKRSTQPKKQAIVLHRAPRDVRAFYSSVPKSPPAKLYRFVYQSATSVLVVFFLLASFLMQGVYIVQANEVDTSVDLTAIPIPSAAEDYSAAPLPETTEVREDSLRDVSDTEAVVPGDMSESEVAGSSVTTEAAIETEVAGSNSEEDIVEVDNTLDGALSTTTMEEVLEEEVSGGGTDSVAEIEIGGESDEGVSVDGEISTTTEQIGPERTLPVSENYSDSGYVFSKTECTELASGSFYCLEPKVNVLPDALFAAPDADGDLEIFLVRDGVQLQVTDNFVDDAAPFFDKNSDTLVWHRLLNDRYQIVSYEISTGQEIMMTKGSSNNMEPIRQGDYTVWQRWVDNNWEVILHDGDAEEQISHSATHDIAPYIHGSLIVWNRYSATGEKTVEMYDIKTRTYVTVDDPDGMSVANPRMVLVYDQLHPNGDIVTKGFDMIERQFIQLDTLPREVPDRLPESEPTDETRALIQSKPTQKSEGSVETEPESDDSSTTLDDVILSQLASSTDGLTLDLNEDTSHDAVVEELIYGSEFDLVIEPYVTESDISASTTTQELTS